MDDGEGVSWAQMTSDHVRDGGCCLVLREAEACAAEVGVLGNMFTGAGKKKMPPTIQN